RAPPHGGPPGGTRFSPRNNRGAPLRRPLEATACAASTLVAAAGTNGGLQLAAGRELRHGRRWDLHLLARIARIDAHACGTALRRELPEAGEVHLATAR